MTLPVLRRLRGLAAVAALAAYGIGPCLSVVGDLGHALEHVAQTAREQQRSAAALGLGHAPAPPAPAPAVVHTHDGSTHAHGSMLGVLLAQDDPRQDSRTGGTEAPVVLAFHLPSSWVGAVRPLDLRAAPRPPAALPADAVRATPPLPPPRG